MVFHDNYELLTLRCGDREIALAGREILSGQPVVLHLLISWYTPEGQRLLRQLSALSAENRRYVIETGDHDGVPFVVTSVLPGKLGLAAWLEGAETIPDLKPAQPEPPASPEFDEVTRLFKVQPVPLTPVKAAVEAGEITSVFIRPPGPSSAQAETVTSDDRSLIFHEPCSPPTASPTAAQPPSELTRIMRSDALLALAAAPGSQGAAAPKTSADDEFTRIFGPAPRLSEVITPPPALPSQDSAKDATAPATQPDAAPGAVKPPPAKTVPPPSGLRPERTL